MAHGFYISHRGSGGPVSEGQRDLLDRFIRGLATFHRFDDPKQAYVFVGGWNGMAFLPKGLLIEIGDWSQPAFMQDLKSLVEFARTIGMAVFSDRGVPDVELPWEKVTELFDTED